MCVYTVLCTFTRHRILVTHFLKTYRAFNWLCGVLTKGKNNDMKWIKKRIKKVFVRKQIYINIHRIIVYNRTMVLILGAHVRINKIFDMIKAFD